MPNDVEAPERIATHHVFWYKPRPILPEEPE